jgi:hypothetical protein
MLAQTSDRWKVSHCGDHQTKKKHRSAEKHTINKNQ